MENANIHKTRYPGIVPFSTTQTALFFGREKNKQALYDLVVRENITLLYAKSGLGKSSLINAGLVPMLAQKGQIIPIFLRFGAYNPDLPTAPVATILSALPTTEAPEWLESVAQDKQTLWYNIKKMCLANPNKTYLMVFDQFEELFTYPEKLVSDFKKQMADLIYKDAPEAVWKACEEKNDLTDAQWTYMETKPAIKTLMSIREDKYSLLNTITDYLPTATQYRYSLEPLDKIQAQEAIIKPAQMEGEFVSNPFVYTPKALHKIINFLTKNGTQPVETTQLQILSNRIESLGLPKIDDENIPNFENIFLEYYESTIAQLPPKEQTRAQQFVEDELVKKSQRISLAEISCEEYVQKETLNALVNKHLLRSELNTTGTMSYELAHDTLIPSIEKAREIRKAKEERTEAERQYQAEQNRLKEQAEKDRKEKKKIQKQFRIVFGLLVLAVIALIWAGYATWQANAEKEKAKKATKEAQANLQKFEDEKKRRKEKEIETLLQAAEAYWGVEEKELAIQTLEALLKKDPNNQKALEKIEIFKKTNK